MRLLFLMLLVCFGSSALALRLSPLPSVQTRPASSGALDREGLIELALVLSGAAPSNLPSYTAILDRWSSDFSAQTDPSWEESKKADALLLFLHTHFKSYLTAQTRLDVLLDKGTFNCVSSAVAYMILGRDAGLDVQAVATVDHAFALVRLRNGREVDVETTTPHGFDPGTKLEFTNSFGQTGFAYVPPGNYSKRRSVNDRQLLGLLVQNRMAEFQKSGLAEDAVGPAIDRWVVEATPEAQKTLIDGFVNYASWLNGRKEYQKGLELVDQMVAWTGPVTEAKDLAWAFLNNSVNVLLDKKDFSAAQVLTQAWKTRGFLTERQVAQTLEIIAEQQLDSAVRTLSYTEAVSQIETSFRQANITPARRKEFLTFVYGQEVQRRASAPGGNQAAWTFLSTLPAEVQAFESLTKAKEVYAYNWSVEAHNRFAQLWNAGKKAEARKTLQEALLALPNSSLLKKDLVLSQGN